MHQLNAECQRAFGKPEHTVNESEMLETFYSKEELEQSPELRIYYEVAKEDEAAAELARLMFALEEYASPEALAKYSLLSEDITGAIKAGYLSVRFTPAEFITWAKGNSIVLPEELKRAIRERNKIYDLRARHDELLKQNERQSNECDALRRENEELRAKLEESEKQDKLNPRVKKTLMRIVIAMATSKPYFYKSERDRSAATKMIWHALDKCKLTMDEDTILKWLRRAAKELPAKVTAD
jgi:hypothetical protein